RRASGPETAQPRDASSKASRDSFRSSGFSVLTYSPARRGAPYRRIGASPERNYGVRGLVNSLTRTDDEATQADPEDIADAYATRRDVRPGSPVRPRRRDGRARVRGS